MVCYTVQYRVLKGLFPESARFLSSLPSLYEPENGIGVKEEKNGEEAHKHPLKKHAGHAKKHPNPYFSTLGSKYRMGLKVVNGNKIDFS